MLLTWHLTCAIGQSGCYGFCLNPMRDKETCASYFDAIVQRPPPESGPVLKLTLMREPRSHVVSQYFQVCIHLVWD